MNDVLLNNKYSWKCNGKVITMNIKSNKPSIEALNKYSKTLKKIFLRNKIK